MRTLLTGLKDAFLAFGGVLRELLFDQKRRSSRATSGCPAARSCTKLSSCVSRTTGASRRAPADRIARDEPLPARRYVSLVLDAPAVTRPVARRPQSVITVEKRPLSSYARLAGGAA